MFKHLFGPVPSRRLGMSLGVDLVPHKVCSFNCVYCECGRTTLLTTKRREYVPVDAVKSELKKYLDEHPKPDYITFSGAGEPTLNSGIGKVLDYIKENWPKIPVAVLTNGSLLKDPAVRKDILKADLVLPSLDAATERTYRRLNRPRHDLDLEAYIQGMTDFRKEFDGKIWLEVFILPGMNDDPENLSALKKAFLKIQPDRIQLNTLDRPGAVEGLQAATPSEMQRIKDFFGMKEVEIIAAAPERKDIPSYRADLESAILETISRRPCTAGDLSSITGIHLNEINKYLGVLETEGKVTASRQERGVFYRLV